jgi:hypothetical protein
MRHPTEGVLRRLLDEPAGVTLADRSHVADCAHCLLGLAEVRSDADLVAATLSTGPSPDGSTDLDVGAAWQRLSAAAAVVPDRGTVTPIRSARRRPGLRRPAVAALAVAVVLTGAGTAAANDWLPIFRAERVEAVSLTTKDLVALPDLSAYGELALPDEPQVRSLSSAADAAEFTGLQIPRVSELPSGVSGEPIHQVVGEVSATFTFSAERAARAAAESGEALPPPPAGLDGSAVRLDAGPGTAQIWTSSSGAPALVVARAKAPRAFSSGVAFTEVRDYLLELPGLPDDVAAQLRTFTTDGSVLPLPVPADQATTSSTQVDGLPATVVQARNLPLTGVVWVEDGAVTVVAGSLSVDEVLSIARNLE